MTENAGDRRPLASRNTRWAQGIARWLAQRAVTPNQISQASMLAAALAGGAFWWAGDMQGPGRIVLLVCAALFCQLRLLCNLFDGMVAVEGGKGAPDGPFWNEFPDRIADILILTGVGYGIDVPELGWAAASFAVLTAYVRELGRANGLPSDFCGPMAKPQRMAIITAAALLSMLEPLWKGQDEVLAVALSVIALGAAITVLRRSLRIVRALKQARPL
ncbi:CDP-alcohol phosphatidyltransferase family protein [Pararhizobium antarcticum]|uniref:CDP-diacylglycerol--glycerol-3-phosphate 3-phosphatidyltransferase n=1 Tax=Pararhizobium antarcticum TaxID=1798805 RepID=A0A657LUQ2_9HYPH|nr:CDP-alcohol phosphatidyltransferase family protein [Pararhizobium antarcticum]OJF95058.1 CDP-diacylglycerol--glycerol-3-phosphate 3-phosphatidyltransferase [Pararhizobium antarcticum]OJF98121.1 CDP-diacylglycerol--glycerol-3-phosphate 3-phosphatidyltransferase [Rhizobium sp. 58]